MTQTPDSEIVFLYVVGVLDKGHEYGPQRCPAKQTHSIVKQIPNLNKVLKSIGCRKAVTVSSIKNLRRFGRTKLKR
jgi:hypothetical protein